MLFKFCCYCQMQTACWIYFDNPQSLQDKPNKFGAHKITCGIRMLEHVHSNDSELLTLPVEEMQRDPKFDGVYINPQCLKSRTTRLFCSPNDTLESKGEINWLELITLDEIKDLFKEKGLPIV